MLQRCIHALWLGLVCALMAACVEPRTRTPTPKFPEPTFHTPARHDATIVAIAPWRDPDGAARIVAANESGNSIELFDGGNGAWLGSIGADGDRRLELLAPSAVHIAHDWLFVAEREAARIRILSLPSFEPLGSLGHAGELTAPAALWAEHIRRGWYRVFVADQGRSGAAPRVANDHGAGLLRVWQVRQRSNGRLSAWHAMTLGGIDPEVPFAIPRALTADRTHDTLLLVEGEPARVRRMRMDGRAVAQPEGSDDVVSMTFRDCPRGTGFWIAAAGDGRLQLLEAADLRTRTARPLQLHQSVRQVAWLPAAGDALGRLYVLASDGSLSGFAEETLSRMPGWGCD